LNIVIEEREAAPPGDKVLGIDMGISNTAVSSVGTLYPGAERKFFKDHRARIRASLQSKGTTGAKRMLKRLAGREQRRIRHENHVLSKLLVAEAKRHKAGTIRLERLRGIRDRTRTRSKQ